MTYLEAHREAAMRNGMSELQFWEGVKRMLLSHTLEPEQLDIIPAGTEEEFIAKSAKARSKVYTEWN